MNFIKKLWPWKKEEQKKRGRDFYQYSSSNSKKRDFDPTTLQSSIYPATQDSSWGSHSISSFHDTTDSSWDSGCNSSSSSWDSGGCSSSNDD